MVERERDREIESERVRERERESKRVHPLGKMLLLKNVRAE